MEIPHEIWLLIAEKCSFKVVRALRCAILSLYRCEIARKIAGSKMRRKHFLGGSRRMLRHYVDFIDVMQVMVSPGLELAAKKVLRILVRLRPWREMKKYLETSCGEVLLKIWNRYGKLTAEDWKEISRSSIWNKESLVRWKNYLDWDYLSAERAFRALEVEACQEKINWKLYSQNRLLDIYDIMRWAKYLDWDYLSGRAIILGLPPQHWGRVKRERIPAEYRAEFEQRLWEYRKVMFKSVALGAVIGLGAQLALYMLGML